MSYFNFSHQTQHPLYKLEVGSRNDHKIYSCMQSKLRVLKGGSLLTTSLQVHGFFVPRGIIGRTFMVGQSHIMLIALNFCILAENMLTEAYKRSVAANSAVPYRFELTYFDRKKFKIRTSLNTLIHLYLIDLVEPGGDP